MNARLYLRTAALVVLGVAAGCSSGDDTLDRVKETLPEIESFVVAPTAVDFGDGATLSWKTTGARRIVISAGSDVLLDTTSEPNGLLEVSPQRTTTYSLRAISPVGEATSEAQVEVQPVILELSTAAGEGPAVIGKPLAVSWRTGAALEVTLTNDADFSASFTGAQALQGWVEAPVTETGTFTLTARSGELEVSRTITVDAIELDEPVISSFESDRLFVTSHSEESVEVSWSVVGATELRLYVDLEPFNLGDRSLEEDSVSLVVNQTTEVILVAKNLAGEAEASVRIVAQPVPTIVGLQAFPARVPAGAGTTLDWVTRDAARVELEADGVPLELGELDPSGTAEIASVVFDTTYLLRAFNDAGASAEASVLVEVGAPEIVSFGAPRPNVAQSVPVDLEWEVLGGTQLTVLDPDLAPVDGCATIDVRAIRAGGCQIVSPAELGAYDYTLSVRDGIGQEVRQPFTLRVVDGPTIESFVTSADRIFPGQSVTLSWVTRTDANGNAPSLTLVDDRDGTYSLAGLDPAEDSIEITPDGEGPYVFTLRAATLGTTPAEASVDVLVSALAVALVAPDEYDPGAAESMELGWTHTDATLLTIWALDEEGYPIEPPVFSEENPAASGSVTIDPEATTTYRAVVENTLGNQAQAEHTVRVIGPEILTFVASPSDILMDEVSTLSWTTANATAVRLDPPANYSIRSSTAPYLAVSERPTSSQLDHTGNTCGGTGTPACPLLVFPTGFTFTYNGHTYDRANVFQSGFISFDLNRDNSTTPTSATNQRLPVNPSGGANTTGWTEVIAPFWTSLNFSAGAGIHYELIEGDPRGRYLAIEWHGMTQAGSGRTSCSTPLGINLILWEDGGFDFRYSMSVTDTSTPNNAMCNGSAASIGFQHDLGEIGAQLSYAKAQVGGIANKAWSMFPATIAPEGMIDVLVPETQIFTLVATGARGRSVSREITVRTHLPPSFSALTTEPVSSKDRNGNDVLLPVNVGSPGSIEWRTINVVGVIVEDNEGNVVCPEATNAVPNGGCAITESTPGIHTYSVTGEDMMGNTVTQTVSFDYREVFRLDSVAASPDEVPANNLAPVTVSWEGVGAASFKLFADGVEIEGLSVADPNQGAVVVNPSRTTTYSLELTSADGRRQSGEVVASVRTFETGTITTPVTVTDGTQPVTIEWETPLLTGGRPMITLEPESFPMVEVTNSPFIDIAGDGTLVPGSLTELGSNSSGQVSLVTFPEGFSFPFFDQVVTELYPMTSGYIGLRYSGNFNVPTPMLAWSGSIDTVHIAPFYDWIRSSGFGSILTKYVSHATDPELDQFVVQWNKMQIGNGSDGSDDLTFQAGLFRDGSIEFRYKTMLSTRLPDRAGASGAVAGFHENILTDEVVGPYRGYELFYKPANPINLNGRSFRYQARKPTDSLTVTPEKTTEYKVCTTFEGFRECKSVVVVVPDAGDLMITELNLDPANGVAEQWIEVRNTTPYSIDIRGMTLTSDSGSVVIEGTSPIVATSGQYLILAASEIAGLDPDYVYGTSFTMGTAVDTLKISYGSRQVAEVSWDPSWNVPAGKTLSLDPRWMRPHVLSNSESERWCDGGAAGTRRTSVSCSSAHYNANPFSAQPFLDISSTGTPIAALTAASAGVERTFSIPGGIGFTIPFFGVPVSSIWVSSNGFAALSGSHEALPINEPIPNPAGSGLGIIAPLWTPLDSRATVYYERLTVGGRQVLVVQWHEAVRYIGNTQNNRPGNVTFQVQIWQNGDIVFSYGDMSAITTPTAGDINPQQEHLGGVGTVGIEAIGGQEGFQYLHKEPILRKGQSIAYINKSGTGGRR